MGHFIIIVEPEGYYLISCTAFISELFFTLQMGLQQILKIPLFPYLNSLQEYKSIHIHIYTETG